jgi:hypothetical protein
MQEMAFPGFKFQKFSGGVFTQTPYGFMCGILPLYNILSPGLVGLLNN